MRVGPSSTVAPARAAVRARARAVGPPGAAGAKVRPGARRTPLLVVGDVPAADALVESLARTGLRADQVATLDAARDRVGPATVAVVLVHPIPGTGRLGEATRALRGDPDGRHVPLFAAVPESTSRAGIRRLYAAGITAVLEWPREVLIAPRLLLELIRRVPRGKPTDLDQRIARNVRARLRVLSPVRRVRLEVRDRVAVLKGQVPTLHDRRAVEAVVRAAPGVWTTHAEGLAVARSGDDAEVRRRVRAALLALAPGPGARAPDVRVDVNDGRVRLRGRVLSRRVALMIRDVLGRVPGVVAIDDELTADGLSPRTDRWLARAIGRRIAAAIPGAEVAVGVFGGIAVLTGSVSSAVDRWRAGDVAREAAEQAIRVVNKIDVDLEPMDD